MSQRTEWSEYWASQGLGGEVFVNPAGEKHPELAEHWRAVFAEHTGPQTVLDVAAGAGSLYAGLQQLDQASGWFAADLSFEALKLLTDRLPEVAAVQCPAQSLPFADGQFSLVVSQFGLEYAGLDAFGEAGRLVAPGGRMELLCHLEGGYIHSLIRPQLIGVRAVQDSGFITAASDLANAAYSGIGQVLQAAKQRFIPCERQLSPVLKQYPAGLHVHLYGGFRHMYENREKYARADIQDWLRKMKREIDVAVTRFTEMDAAALTEEGLHSVRAQLEAAGCRDVGCQPFQSPGHNLPLAWRISAAK